MQSFRVEVSSASMGLNIIFSTEFQQTAHPSPRIIPQFLQTLPMEIRHKERKTMKATGIVRRVDDLGRIVIPKEIRRTLRIREGDLSLTSLTQWERYCFSMLDLAKRRGW